MRYAALFESARTGLDALRSNPLRTALSTTGVVIGVAALVAAFAITDGVAVWSRELIMRESSVQDVSITPATNSRLNGRTRVVHGAPRLTIDDAKAAHNEVPGVTQQLLMMNGNADVSYLDRRANALLTLASASIADFSSLELAGGRFFTDAEESHGAAVIVLGQHLATELAGMRDPLWLIGREVKIGPEHRTVLGVLASPRGGTEEDFVAFVPMHGSTTLIAAEVVSRGPTLRLKARSIEAVDTLQQATVDWVAERFGRRMDKLEVLVANQQLANTRMAILLTKLLLGMLVGLILGVGGIGIMNVLLAAVAERTREIGIRKAVGARASDIQMQFLVESVMVTGAGAAFGFVIGLVLAFGGTALFRAWLGSNIHPVVGVNTALLAVMSSVSVGLIFGTYPARRAARLLPIEAIARE